MYADAWATEYTCVRAENVVAFESSLDWSILGAVPEMLHTTWGALDVGLDAQPGQSILIRGGTSSIGMATAVLAKRLQMKVFSTTRSAAKSQALKKVGVDYVLIDDGNVAAQVREIDARGVDCAIELVGTDTLPDTLKACKVCSNDEYDSTALDNANGCLGQRSHLFRGDVVESMDCK